MSQARQKRKYKFVFKRKIYLPSQNSPSDDEMYKRLLYLQAEDDVITQGTLPIKDEATAIKLAAISYRIYCDEDFPEDADTLLNDDDFKIHDFIPAGWRGKKSDSEFANLVLAQRNSVLATDVNTAQDQFVEVRRGTSMFARAEFHASCP